MIAPDGWIVSKAHDWVGLLPSNMHMVKCTRCGVKTKIGEWNIERCSVHFESDKSGYLNEADA